MHRTKKIIGNKGIADGIVFFWSFIVFVLMAVVFFFLFAMLKDDMISNVSGVNAMLVSNFELNNFLKTEVDYSTIPEVDSQVKTITDLMQDAYIKNNFKYVKEEFALFAPAIITSACGGEGNTKKEAMQYTAQVKIFLMPEEKLLMQIAKDDMPKRIASVAVPLSGSDMTNFLLVEMYCQLKIDKYDTDQNTVVAYGGS